MKAWTSSLFIVAILSIILAVSQPAAAYCSIATNLGLAPDYDCDGIIDEMDNCPSIPNAGQGDANRNSIGDACDLLIEEILVNPDNHLRQGEIAHVTVRVVNNHETGIGNIGVAVKNTELGIDAEQTLGFLPQGEVASLDFWIVIPKCAKAKTYDLTVTADVDGNAEVQRQSVIVDKGTVCGTASGPLDYTVINVFNQVDIEPGTDIIIPIKIINLGENQATYDLSASDLGNWGTWRIDPAPRVTLAAGHSDTLFLYVQSEEHIEAGRKTVELSVVSGKQRTTVPIDIYVRVPKKEAASFGPILLQMLFIIILLALIIAVIVIAVRRRGEPKTASEKKTTTETKTEKPRKTVKVEDAEKSRLETYY